VTRLTSSAVVAKPTRRPTKRKIEPGATDKVMPTKAPREAVTRISRDTEAAPSADDLTAVDGDESAALAGTRARKAAAADKVEPTKGRRRSRRTTEKEAAVRSSSRYTPPSQNYADMPSPLWVPVLMFVLLGAGMLTIFLNYLGMVPGGDTSNWYLLLGLGFILGGIITATQYR
jgi:hypothetical protein